MSSTDERIGTVESLHRRYAAVLYDRCLRLLGNPADAEDAVQETFLQAFRSLPTFKDEDRGHLPWLYTIATSMCLRMLRTRRRKGAATAAALPFKDPGDIAGVEDPLAAIISRQLLVQLTERFDDRTLSILIGHYLDGRSQGQIAGQLGISRRAVVKRLTKLRKVIRPLMEGSA
jgi:RNA polymerase sigma-70 factor (ECF subfamily)